MNGAHSSANRKLLNLLLAGSAILAATACESISEKPAAPPAGACSSAFSRTVPLQRLDGGHHLYFSVADLSFLLSPAIVIDRAVLNASLKGKCGGDPREVSLAVNGFQASRDDGRPACGLHRYRDRDDATDTDYELHRMRLNGSETFREFLFRVLKNQGELRLSLEGPNVHVQDASVTFTGVQYQKCPSPAPAPAPAPVAPHTSIVSATPAGATVAAASMTIAFASDQGGVTFACSLDGSARALCASPKTYSGLANGPHRFTVAATNAAGLTDATGAAYAWTASVVAPSVTINGLTSIPGVTNSTSLSLTFSASGATSFRCALDGGAYAACTSPVSYTGLAEGAHQLQIVAVDAAGNTSPTPATLGWTIDLTAPVTSLLDVQPGATLINTTGKLFSFGADESATFECSVDQAGFAPCASPQAVGPVAEGSHLFEVRATDLAGNVGTAASHAWSVDLTAPVIQILESLPAPGITNGRNISVNFTADEPATFACSLDGQVPSPCLSPFAESVGVEGPHLLAIVATDFAGNVSTTEEIRWSMDFTSPDLSFGAILPSAADRINSSSVTVNVNSSEQATLSVALDGVTLSQTASPIQLDGLPEGLHTLTVTALDPAGNPSNTLTRAFTVDLTAPTLTLAATVTGGPSRQTANTLAFSADESATFECDFDGAGFAACASPLTLSGLADGPHVFSVRATDLAGNPSAPASVSWSIDTLAPVTSLTEVRNGANIVFTPSSSEAGSTFACALDGAAFLDCAPPVSYLNLAPGNHTFTVRATDPAGNTDPAGATYAFYVEPPITTTITGSSAAAVTSQTSISVFFSSNRAGATFQCRLDAAPSVPCASPASYSGLSDGSHHLLVQAIDLNGAPDATGATLSWTVDTAAPVASGIGVATTSTTLTVSWTTNEPATTQLFWGVGFDTSRATAEVTALTTSHSVKLTGLTPNTLYSYQVAGKDQAGNAATGAKLQARTNH